MLANWFRHPAGWFRGASGSLFAGISKRWSAWRESRVQLAKERARQRALRRAMKQEKSAEENETAAPPSKISMSAPETAPPIVDHFAPPFVPPAASSDRALEEIPDPHAGGIAAGTASLRVRPRRSRRAKPLQPRPVHPRPKGRPRRRAGSALHSSCRRSICCRNRRPRAAFDSQELKDTAARSRAKFEEFNVLGSVVQINPGPVVTTFEFKPEAGIKYTRITTLDRRPVPRACRPNRS